MNLDDTEKTLEYLREQGYYGLRVLDDGRIIGLWDLLYTTGLFVDLDLLGYSHRYCFDSTCWANAAIKNWDGEGDPPGPWIVRKGEGEDKYRVPDIGQ